MDLLYDTLFNGLAIGSVLVLAALGLAVVFGLMGVINMAHGELMMLGSYTTFVVQNIFKAVLPDALFPIYILVALPCAFLVSGLAGLLLEKTVIRRLYGRPLGICRRQSDNRVCLSIQPPFRRDLRSYDACV